MHAEPDGSFSVVGLVWRPGQITPVHDHVTWCVIGVLQGAEYEELFALREGGTVLEEVGTNAGAPGDVSGFAPPGDIHRVRNRGTDVAISLHVYGADISRLGSSVRRIYDLPCGPPGRAQPAARPPPSSRPGALRHDEAPCGGIVRRAARASGSANSEPGAGPGPRIFRTCSPMHSDISLSYPVRQRSSWDSPSESCHQSKEVTHQCDTANPGEAQEKREEAWGAPARPGRGAGTRGPGGPGGAAAGACEARAGSRVAGIRAMVRRPADARPRVKRGDVRAAALALLADGPRNGYQIIQEISERSSGLWKPSPGSVYPALQQLEDEGLIAATTGEGGRRAFELTERAAAT